MYGIISSKYNYLGYDFNPSQFKIFISFILFSSFSVIINSFKKNNWQNYLIIYWFFLSFTPFLVFFSYNDTNISLFISHLIFIVVFCMGYFTKQKNFVNIKKFTRLEYLFLLISVFIGIILYYQSPTFNIASLLLDSANVYEDRLLFRYKESTILSSYFFSPFARIIIPFLTLHFIFKKKYIIALFTFLISIIFFITTGSLKSMLFAPLLVLVVYKICHAISFKNYLLKFFIIIMLISLFENYLFDTTIISNYSIRRFLFTPSLLSNIYFEYFQQFPAAIFGLNPLETYDMPIARYVGAFLMNNAEARASVGVLVEFWLNFRLFGVLLAAILIYSFFYVLDASKLSKLLAPVVIPFIYYINTSFIGPLLLSHGFWVLFLLAILYKYDNTYFKKSQYTIS